MCIEMVIIGKKSLDRKNSDDVSADALGRIAAPTMSQGPVLFSCGIMEATRWRDAALPRSPDSGSALDGLWSRPLEAGLGHCTSLSSLLRDLDLSSSADACSAAPPSKRQCRSLSCSDDLGRAAWRPQGSRLWTSVEKRRCHSGGSVHRPSAAPLAFPSMQRSSSVNLALPALLHPPAARTLSPRGSPDSTPETQRRRGQSPGPGLPRSKSQPCVSNEKKAGVKRRRQDEAHKRPSLDLAKMTQKLRSFHSLSCPGISSDERCGPNHGPNHDPNHGSVPPPFQNKDSNRLYADTPAHGTKESAGNGPFCLTIEDCGDVTSPAANQKEGEALWAGRCSLYQLGGELDIEQIERN